LFSIDGHIPKLNVASSILVSRSNKSMICWHEIQSKQFLPTPLTPFERDYRFAVMAAP
jgi:hypothetical protein